jgi:prepilin-type N-terminal cleavage/methylation domain-containing protein
MKRSKGFTLIEILVTITIMVILMTLAVASIRSTQVRARDEDRRNDAENISRQLDALYTKGYTFPYTDSTATEVSVTLRGSYPSTLQMSDPESRAAIFADLPPASLIDPSKNSSDETIMPAENTLTGLDANVAASSVLPAPGSDFPYVYQPIAEDGTLCDSDAKVCRKFNLYYQIENTPKISGVVKSKNR